MKKFDYSKYCLEQLFKRVPEIKNIKEEPLKSDLKWYMEDSSDPNVAPTPLVPIIIDIDTLGDIGPGHMGLTVTYHVNCIAVDPAHPPVLTGIRLLHAP